MRHTILLSTLLLFVCSAYAQVTIDQSNFPRQATFLDSFAVASANGNGIPSHGASQTWDYSTILNVGLLTSLHTDATNNTDFPDALEYSDIELGFLSFVFPVRAYNAVDANGFYDYGREVYGAGFSVTPISGGATDSLFFPANKSVFNDRRDFVQFPATYQSRWSQTSNDNTNFELSIAAFGLNKTPGFQRRNLVQTREVVGHGQLIIPMLNGNPSAPMDVLLIRETRMISDSFYLGGAPAPVALMNAFGISQGQSFGDSTYYFYRPGFPVPLMRIGLPDATEPVPVFSFRPQGALTTTGITKALDVDYVALSPNPTTKGQKLSFTTTSPIGMGRIHMYDTQGRKVEVLTVRSSGARQYESTLPGTLPSGLYFYSIINQEGILKGQGKLMIQ
ncbi:MAG: T9SS type A sorting domain-containing protein [Bacteroidia bacterium]